jgi:hypothetical protein
MFSPSATSANKQGATQTSVLTMAPSVTAADDSLQGARGDSSQTSIKATDGLDWPERQEGDVPLAWSMSGRMDTVTGKSSAVQRHFAQFERHQLDQVNDEIELGWNCGIW